ncbi:MAG TPA: DNA ligase, partial [Acidimicrobiia bacterium]
IRKTDRALLPMIRRISLPLTGQIGSGGYALTRIGTGDDERWLLIEKDDEESDARRNPTSTEPTSVLTGRTVKEVQQEG